VPLGATGTFTKTVSESDVYLYAGITGDLHPNHLNEEFMKEGRFGQRIAHGTLLLGFMPAASANLFLGWTAPASSNRRSLAIPSPPNTRCAKWTTRNNGFMRTSRAATIRARPWPWRSMSAPTWDKGRKTMSILLEEERNDVLLLTLNRPEARNALSGQLAERLAAKLESIADRRDLRAVIITGSGDKAFCAGADLKERRDMNADQKWAQRGKLWRVNMLLWRAAQPVIAAVNGFCMGGGFEMALFSDFRIAVPEAVFSFPEMSLGAYPGAGGPIALPRLIGRARAKEILFSARRVTADEALELGIIEDVVPGADLQDRAFALANSFKASSPRGVAGVKRLINLGADLSIDMAGDLNDAIRRPLEASADYEEGINAFFEKRKPVFRGD